MKNKLKELDVDFIGGQLHPLTKEEELAISDFIRKQKAKRQQRVVRRAKKNISQKALHSA